MGLYLMVLRGDQPATARELFVTAHERLIAAVTRELGRLLADDESPQRAPARRPDTEPPP